MHVWCFFFFFSQASNDDQLNEYKVQIKMWVMSAVYSFVVKTMYDEKMGTSFAFSFFMGEKS